MCQGIVTGKGDDEYDRYREQAFLLKKMIQFIDERKRELDDLYRKQSKAYMTDQFTSEIQRRTSVNNALKKYLLDFKMYADD